MSGSRKISRGRLLLASLILSLGLGLPVQAQNLCATQASRVNPLALELPDPAQARDDTGGIGGTGVVAGRPGIGGTGISEGGMGGTGIVGVITGFASICVNGLELQYDAGTPVSDNGMPVSTRQLALGQLVAVRATGAGEALSARHIALRHAAVGPLQTLNAVTGEFRILGQPARALNPGDLAGLQVGNWARVSGHRLAQGEIVASRIEPITPQAQVQLHGLVSRIDTERMTLEGTPIHFDGRPMPPGLAPGREVLVSGQWDGTSLRAQGLQLDPTRGDLGLVEHVVFEGYIHALRGQELKLDLGSLTLNPDVQIVGGSAAELAVNQRVRLSGRLGADQRVTIERVEFRGAAVGSGRDSKAEPRKGSGASDDKGPSNGKGSSGSSGSSSGAGGSGNSGGSGGSGGPGRSGGHK